MGFKYSDIFRNKMGRDGITLRDMGIRLANYEKRSKPYVTGNILFYLEKTNDKWKIEDIKKWCIVLGLDFTKVMKSTC